MLVEVKCLGACHARDMPATSAGLVPTSAEGRVLFADCSFVDGNPTVHFSGCFSVSGHPRAFLGLFVSGRPRALLGLLVSGLPRAFRGLLVSGHPRALFGLLVSGRPRALLGLFVSGHPRDRLGLFVSGHPRALLRLFGNGHPNALVVLFICRRKSERPSRTVSFSLSTEMRMLLSCRFFVDGNSIHFSFRIVSLST